MKLRVFFDPGSGICLWAKDDEARERFGYPIDLRDLSLTSMTIETGEELIRRFDTSLDWNNPAGPSPWTIDQTKKFNEDTELFIAMLKCELGPAFAITNEVHA